MPSNAELRAARPRRRKPEAELRAAPSWYERTHPVGSAERFLDQAAKEALSMAAAGGVPSVRDLVPRAAIAIAKESGKRYPDPLLSEATKLPAAELAKRAAKAEAYRQAMKRQNEALRVVAAMSSPVGNTVKAVVGADAHEALTSQTAKGGRTVRAAQGAQEATPPRDSGVASVPQGGPRIVINPTTFRNSKDALCVAFNEGFRLWMEATGFEPQSEPTERQRRFFSDTAYADDEVQLRRTILARIATFDTSVKDPTDDQLAETGSFLDAILESDWCRNEWERSAVSRLSQAVKASVGAEPVEPRPEPLEARPDEPLQANAAMGGGETDEKERVELSGADVQAALRGMDPRQEEQQQTAVQEPAETPQAGEDPAEQAQEPAPDTAETAQEGAPDRQTQETGGPSGAEESQAAENEAHERQQEQEVAEANRQAGREDGQQDKPGAQEEPEERKRNPLSMASGVWSGGAEGQGRQLTAREAEWMQQRIDSGASVSDRQLKMFGLSRADQGGIADASGELFQGFGDDNRNLAQTDPDAGLDREETRQATDGRRRITMNGPAIEPTVAIGQTAPVRKLIDRKKQKLT